LSISNNIVRLSLPDFAHLLRRRERATSGAQTFLFGPFLDFLLACQTACPPCLYLPPGGPNSDIPSIRSGSQSRMAWNFRAQTTSPKIAVENKSLRFHFLGIRRVKKSSCDSGWRSLLNCSFICSREISCAPLIACGFSLSR
jgi:hypothetical protein